MASPPTGIAPLGLAPRAADDSVLLSNDLASASPLLPTSLDQSDHNEEVLDLRSHAAQHNRTTMPNCRKKITRFEYLKDSVIIRTPCFETNCRTCGPEVERLARSLGTWGHDRAVEHAARASATEHMKKKAREDVEKRVGWVKNMHVRNAPAVKSQKRKQKLDGAVVGGGEEPEAGKHRLKERRGGVASGAFGEKREHRKIVRLAFKDKKEEYRKLLEQIERRAAKSLVVKLRFEKRREEFEELVKGYENTASNEDTGVDKGQAELAQETNRAESSGAGEETEVAEFQERKPPKLFLKLSKGQITPRWEGTPTKPTTYY